LGGVSADGAVSAAARASKAEALASKVAKANVVGRIDAIDVLRGFVMVLMAIDHASEQLNRGRLFTDSVFFFTPGSPLPAAQFMTRWITHLCAPTFVTLAGVALAISSETRRAKGEPDKSIGRHILYRGLLILGLEVVWMSPVMMEGFGKYLFQVLYAIGMSLVCMSVLRRLSVRALAMLGIGLALGSELLLNGVMAAGVGKTIPSAVIISGGFFFNWKFIVAYPLLPWLSMMILGWVFGRLIVQWRTSGISDEELRVKASGFLFRSSAVLLTMFVLLRALNRYGNMGLLREGSDIADVVQWLHVSKYPPSVTYTGLELGIASLILAFLFRLPVIPRSMQPLKVLGSTALFFYLLHLHVLSLVAYVTNWQHQLGIKSSYIGGLAVCVALYPLCAWYGRYKRAHPRSLAQWI
jgi:uncharacterized membrane protein